MASKAVIFELPRTRGGKRCARFFRNFLFERTVVCIRGVVSAEGLAEVLSSLRGGLER